MIRLHQTLRILSLAILATLASAQQLPHHPHADPDPAAISLPVTSVSLYKNGVGYFEHSGRVSGNATVSIDLTSGQLNDVLQSLTAIDLNGGRIAGADYNSTTPLDQQLKTLPLALGTDPSALDFYNAIRGTRVEVTGSGPAITGRLLSVEARALPGHPTSPDNDSAQPTRNFLTIVSDAGDTRTLELTSATAVRLLDPALHTNVTRYLQLLDANRGDGLRHLTLTDNGPEGPASKASRELRISYISEVPIWKSTYRILLTNLTNSPGPHPVVGGEPQTPEAPQTATLQGWSVVDNTTGADWINVHLSLIAGSPQSFIQPLSQPIYARRPEVPIAQDPQLTPQTFDSSLDGQPLTSPAKMARLSEGVVAGSAGGIGTGYGNGIGAGSGGNLGGGIYKRWLDAPAVTYEDAATNSLTPAAKTAGFDDFYAYALTQPVTLLKNQSALVPILQAKVAATPVTLISYANGQLSQPLRALWLTNTSGLTLDRGSFTIIEDGNFAGEGLLDPIHPDEKRLLSYAADQAVHAATQDDKTTNRLTFLRGSKGVLNIHRAEVHDLTLVLHNAASAPRTIVSEVPVVSGWKLDSLTNPASSDPKPVETTPTVYRYRTLLAPGQTAQLHIGATRSGYTTYYLSRSDDNQFQLILSQSDQNPQLLAALQPILDARHRVADAQSAVDQTNQRLTTLRSDEDRQRANITALATADKNSRERFVHDLNTTEDAITAAQSELAQRTTALDAAKADLATHIEAFSINTK